MTKFNIITQIFGAYSLYLITKRCSHWICVKKSCFKILLSNVSENSYNLEYIPRLKPIDFNLIQPQTVFLLIFYVKGQATGGGLLNNKWLKRCGWFFDLEVNIKHFRRLFTLENVRKVVWKMGKWCDQYLFQQTFKINYDEWVYLRYLAAGKRFLDWRVWKLMFLHTIIIKFLI